MLVGFYLFVARIYWANRNAGLLIAEYRSEVLASNNPKKRKKVTLPPYSNLLVIRMMHKDDREQYFEYIRHKRFFCLLSLGCTILVFFSVFSILTLQNSPHRWLYLQMTEYAGPSSVETEEPVKTQSATKED